MASAKRKPRNQYTSFLLCIGGIIAQNGEMITEEICEKLIIEPKHSNLYMNSPLLMAPKQMEVSV